MVKDFLKNMVGVKKQDNNITERVPVPKPSDTFIHNHYETQLKQLDDQISLYKNKLNSLKDEKVNVLDLRFQGKDKWNEIIKFKHSIEMLDANTEVPYTTKYNLIVKEFNNTIQKIQLLK